MKRFIVIISASALILIGIGASIYYWFGRGSKQQSEAICAIPIDAALIFKTDNFADLSAAVSQNRLTTNINKIYEFRDIANFYTFIDSLHRANTTINKLLTSNPLYLAYCSLGGNNYWLLSTCITSGINRSDIMDVAQEHTKDSYTEEKTTYNQTSILTLHTNKKNSCSYSVSIHKNVLIASNSKLLVEKAIGQIDEGISLTSNPQFADILKISGKGMVANLFLNYKNLPAIIKSSVDEKHTGSIRTFADLALWTEFDFRFSDNNLIVSGLSNFADSSNSFLRILASQKPVDQTLPNILPAGTGAFIWLGVSNQEKYLDDYREYLDRKHEVFKYTQTLNSWKGKLGISPEEIFSKIGADQFVIAHIPSANAEESDSWCLAENTSSPSATRDMLLKLTETYNKNCPTSEKNWKTSVAIDREKKVDIYRFPAMGLHNAVWGSLFPPEIDKYYCFVDNNIVFSNSENALVAFMKSSVRNNTLGNDVNFTKFNSEISKKGNFCFYSNPARAASLIREYTKPPVKQFLISTAQSGVLGLSYQMIGGNNYVFSSFTATSGKLIRTSSNQTAWVSKLDEKPTMKPQIVVNHNTREREVFIQDSTNNAYLINSQGRILWKRNLPGQILGDIEQIDVYRNGRLQFAFSTPTALYIIDRNGKDIDGFPIQLPSSATSPLTIADYDGTRDYRLFQTCADKGIYVYDTKGKPVSGWTFGKTETTVTEKIGIAKAAGKDYIVVFDGNRPYILNRKGEERIKPKEYFAKAQNSTFTLCTNADGSLLIITTDTLGLIRTIDADGTVKSAALKSFGSTHAFCYEDIDGDGSKDYIVLDGQNIMAFNQKKEVIFNTKMSDSIDPKMMIFNFDGQKKIGLVSAQTDNIYLINCKGKTEDTFPLQGSTPFTITKFNASSDTYNLIVGTKQGAVVNYSIK